ncbi:hypothetical protein FBY06_14052 [Pseudomonas sp. SJZ085]|nr:hypothetical protein FBX99_13952 [Pseudomonas sp. SJZ074]TWC30629.1 hypothetical protein FBY06_14052 [Pseudomonas sp. SJZ085]
MARRKTNNRLDTALEMWVRWSYPGVDQGTTGRTMLAKLIDNKGELFFGGGGQGPGADGLESKIEAGVYSMFVADPLRADVLRLEYDAAYWQVVTRRGIEDYDPRGIGQFEKAAALGVSLRTYRSRLAEARETIAKLLGYL